MSAFNFGSNFKVNALHVTITAAQLKTGNSVPVVLVPAPGSGKRIILIAGFATLNFVSAAMATGADAELIIKDATKAQMTLGNGLSFINSASTTSVVAQPGGSQLDQSIANKQLQLVVDADSASGDSTLTIDLLYAIVG